MSHFSQIPPSFEANNNHGDDGTARLACPARAEDLETLSWFLGHLLNRTDPYWLTFARRPLTGERRTVLERVYEAICLLQAGSWQKEYTLTLARTEAQALLDALNAANLLPDYETICSIGTADGFSPQDAAVKTSYRFTALSLYISTLSHRLHPGATTNLIACINEVQDRLPPGCHAVLVHDDIKISARALVHMVSVVSMSGTSGTAPATLKWTVDPDRVERLRAVPIDGIFIAQLTLDNRGALHGGVYRVLMEPALVELTADDEEIARHN